MSSSNSISECVTEDRRPDALHAWCRWRTFINHFLIDRIRFGWKPRGDMHATTYFQILNGIEVPPTLTPEQHHDVCFISSDDPKTLDWQLKHNIPRAEYRCLESKNLYSSSSINSLSNSEVSFGSSGLSSGWTSYSSLESDGDLNLTKDQRRRRRTRRKSNHANDKSLLTWSRLKLKLTQRKRQSANPELVGASSSQTSPSVSPVSSDYSERTGQRQSSGHCRHDDNNCSMNSRKFPLVSKIFLPDWSTDDQRKLHESLSKDSKKRLMTDKQGRVFIDVGHILRHGHPLDVEKSDQHVRMIFTKDVPAPKVRPRLRMYGSATTHDVPAEQEYLNFMFDKFKQLYQEDAPLLTTLSQQPLDNITGSQPQNSQRTAKMKKKLSSKHEKLPSELYLQHYGKF